MADAVGRRAEDARLRLFRQVEAIARDEGIRRIENGQVVGISFGDVVRKVACEMQEAVGEAFRAADEGHATRREVTEIHGRTAVSATHRNGDMLLPLRRGGGVPQAQHTEPPHEVASAIAPRRPVMGSEPER